MNTKTEKDTVKRRDDALRRALKTPPKPHKAIHNVEPHYLVIGGKLRVAGRLKRNADGSITADIYRNLDDFRADRAMERATTFSG